MRLGQKAMDALQAEVTGCLQPGDELVVACPVALGGTSRIAKQEREKLSERFSAGFVCDCMLLQQEYGFSKKDHEGRDMSNLHLEEKAEGSSIWQMAVQAGASALYAMGEGGFLSALWKVAEASQVGLTVDFRKVPVRQETIEVCEIFDLNPYKLCSHGSVLIGICGGEALVQELHNAGYEAAVIGQTNAGNDRLLYSGGNARYLERPAEDELYKVCKKQKK